MPEVDRGRGARFHRAADRRRGVPPAGALVRRGADRMRSSLHLLHHLAGARAEPVAAGRGGGRSHRPRSGRRRAGNRPHRRRHHQLRAGWRHARHSVPAHPRCRAALEAPSPVLARQCRDRRAPVRADRRRAAPAAAFPSVAPGGRRHDPEADEAPPQPRRRRRHRRAAEGGPARHDDRRRPHRRLSHRNRGHGCQLAQIARRLRHHRRPHLPLLAARRTRPRRECRSSSARSSRPARHGCARRRRSGARAGSARWSGPASAC